MLYFDTKWGFDAKIELGMDVSNIGFDLWDNVYLLLFFAEEDKAIAKR